jgi:hypothetical protein
MSIIADKTLKKNLRRYPTCSVEHGGKRTREGDKSGIGRLERMKRGNGIKDLDERSSGIEILMVDVFTKINPTDPLLDPLRLVKQVT